MHLLLNISLGINCAINEYNLEIENFQIEDFSKANERMAKILNHSVNGSYGGDSDDSGHILKDDNIRRNCGHEIFFFLGRNKIILSLPIQELLMMIKGHRISLRQSKWAMISPFMWLSKIIIIIIIIIIMETTQWACHLILVGHNLQTLFHQGLNPHLHMKR